MNNIETMKLALEALEEIHVGNMTPMAEINWNKAITSLRQAIEQAQQAEPVAGWTGNIDADAALVILDRLDVLPDDDDRVNEISKIVRRLATPSPRQPLTDEEIINEADRFDWAKDCAVQFARAIEAAHGIKGEA